jgi:hypothetical protein
MIRYSVDDKALRRKTPLVRHAVAASRSFACDRSLSGYIVTVIGHILGQIFLVGAGPIGVIRRDRAVPFVRVSLFSGNLQGAVDPSDLKHLIAW